MLNARINGVEQSGDLRNGDERLVATESECAREAKWRKTAALHVPFAFS